LTVFVVTLGAVGAPYPWLMLDGFCKNVTSCAAGMMLGPIFLVVAVMTGFVAGRLSPSTRLGLLVALVAAIAPPTILLVAVEVAGGEPRAEWGYGAQQWLGFTVVVVLPFLIAGFLMGRSTRESSARKRAREDAAGQIAGEIAGLAAWRDVGKMSTEDFERQKAVLLRSLTPPDQAPPNHRCGRCGKSLSPAWHGKCKHCGAFYADFPPVPSE
jgi:hypothetical protein